MTSDRCFFSGDSLAQALNQAAQQFERSPGEIKYKVLDKRHGFLKVRRKVVIEVDGADPFLSPDDASGTRSVAGSSPAPPASQSPPVPRAPATSDVPPAAEPSPEPRASAADLERPVSTVPAEPEVPAKEPPTTTLPETFAAPGAAEEPPEGPGAPEEMPAGEPPLGAEPSAAVEAPVGLEDQPTAEWQVVPEPTSGPGPDDKPDGAVALPDAPPPARSRYPAADGEEASAAADALERILELAALDLESEILRGEEELLIELWGEDQDILLRDRGRLLLAIQHLMPRAIRGLIGRSVVCKVDSDDFHMIREERLRDMAQRAADEVRHRGRPKTLEPMSPDERRIVHLTLADYPGIETESHGSGLFKRVMVRASRGERPGGSYRR